METTQNPILALDLGNKYPYESGRAALLALPLIANENSEHLLAQVSDLVSLNNPLSFASAERNVLLALDALIAVADSPADVGGLANILAFRLRTSRITSLRATADVLLSEYIGDRAATAERIAQFYREPSYAKILWDFDRCHDDPRPELMRELLRRAGYAPERISDIGCGTADLGFEVAKVIVQGAHQPVYVTRLDINTSIIYGAEVEGQSNKDVHVTSYCADFFKPWPIPDNSQDLIVIAEVLEHAFDPEWLLREAKRVLRENGLVLITVPNAWHWKKVFRFLFHQRLERDFLSDHIQHFSKRTLKELINNEGYDILSIIPFSLHSETSALFHWEPAKSIKRQLHRLYSRLPSCGWNYMALGRLRRTRENPESPAVKVSGVITLGRELLRLSKSEAVQQTLSKGLYLLDHALQQSRARGLSPKRTVQSVLLYTLERVVSASTNTTRPLTLESWLERLDTTGWSKGMLVLLESSRGPVDSTDGVEWKMVRREAELIWD